MVELQTHSKFFPVAVFAMVFALGSSSCALYEEAEPLDRALAVDELEISPDPVRVELYKSRSDVTARMFDRGGQELDGLEVSWSSADESIATVDDNGVVEGLALGDTTITATVGQQEATATVVVFTPVSRVEVAPEEAFVDVGERLELSATVYGEADTVLPRQVEWSSADEDIATVDADGRVTGVAEGEATIRAETTGMSGTAKIIVREPVDRIKVIPVETTIEVTETVQLEAVVFDVNDQPRDDRSVDWSSNRPEVASVDATGLVEGLTGGEATIIAESGGKRGEVSVTVEAPVDKVNLGPNPASVNVADTVQMNATLTDAAGNELSGISIDWEVDDESIATIDNDGLATGRKGGEVTVTATSEGVSDTARLVVDDPVASVEVSPATVSLNVLDTEQLSVTIEDAAGNELDDRSVTWRSGDGDIARVDANGLVTARNAGVVDIIATSEGVEGTAQITVDNPVTTVEVSPSAPTIEVTDTLQLTATPKDVRGNILTGHTAVWTSSDPQVVSVDANGLIEGLEGGSATITAQVDNITGTADITVEDPVRNVAVTPSTSTVEVTDTVQLSVELQDKGGNILTGRTVNWSSSDDAVATVDASGLVTAVAGGVATITAESEGASDTADTTVDNPVRSVEVSPDPATVEVADTVQLTATPRDKGGNALSGYTVTWSSDDISLATVDSSGLVSGEKGGAVTISASVDDGAGNTVTGTSSVTVDDPVATVLVSPTSFFIFPNDQAQIDVTLEDANGNELSGRTVTWSSQDVNVVTVDTSGLATGQAVGSTMITAESEGVTGTVDVEIVEWTYTDTGRDYSCGVLSNARGYCWGKNTVDGIIGDGSTDSGQSGSPNRDADKTSPALVAGDHRFATIHPGFYHTCGLDVSGEAYCWGYGGAGALGQGSGNSSAVPVAVSGGYVFDQLGIGVNHSCARTSNDTVHCWGANTLGQIGIGSSSSAFAVPQDIQGYTFVHLDVGANHNCAIEESGDTYCWGSNSSGQLGDGTTTDANAPVAVNTTEQFVALNLGTAHSCGITSVGEIYCWGNNAYSQLGDGTTTNRLTPVRADATTTYAELTAGGFATCGVNGSQEVYCWGFNGQGNLGTGSYNVSEPTPVKISGSYRWDAVLLGYQHTCGLPVAPVDNYCWGDNEYGQVGDGTDANDRQVPEQVLRP